MWLSSNRTALQIGPRPVCRATTRDPVALKAVIVDVLCFSTALEAACARGAEVLPYRLRDEAAVAFAQANAATLAVPRTRPGFSLSPPSLLSLTPGTRLVLPSANGSRLTLLCKAAMLAAGCLRNVSAIAGWAGAQGRSVTVIAAGERWPDDTLRPAIEDLVGAGAIISHLSGNKSPEALVAQASWLASQEILQEALAECASGRELIRRGFAADVRYAADIDCSTVIPVYADGCYRRLQA
jgi:2-phosphosulfolactate phosphatase